MKRKRVDLPSTPAAEIFKPFREFAAKEVSGGLILIVVTIIALVLANSPFQTSYLNFWESKLGFHIGDFEISKTLNHWINDGLMAIFFFVVGMEIKREILVGELQSMRKATLPIAAAFGGMLIPALIFFSLNSQGIGKDGWGIPMATDIAFALGILAILGNRVPIALKVFLTALAVIDDLGAVLVIAIFYTDQVYWAALGAAALILGILFVFNRLGIKSPAFYLIPGVLLWFCFLKSGLHATIAGVLLAMTIPASARLSKKGFLKRGTDLMAEFNQAQEGPAGRTSGTQLEVLHALHQLSQHAESTLQRLEHSFLPWSTYVVIPIFALANAGVIIEFQSSFLTHSITLGVFLGLVVGKLIGVTLFSWLVVRFNFAELPKGVKWEHLIGAAALAGIGFTMSLFITNLAYVDLEAQKMAKFGIIAASLFSAIIGLAWLSRLPRADERDL